MALDNRLFTDEELEEFGKGYIDMAMEALDQGDIEKAKHWCHKNEETKMWIHDHYVYWVAALLSHIQKRYGEDAAVEALKDTYFLPVLGLERAKKVLGMKEWVRLCTFCVRNTSFSAI